jgi:hypothetical protein
MLCERTTVLQYTYTDHLASPIVTIRMQPTSVTCRMIIPKLNLRWYIVSATVRQETVRLSGIYVCEVSLLPMVIFIDHFPRMRLCHGNANRCQTA